MLWQHVQMDTPKIQVECAFCQQLFVQMGKNQMEMVIVFLQMFQVSVQADTQVMEMESVFWFLKHLNNHNLQLSNKQCKLLLVPFLSQL